MSTFMLLLLTLPLAMQFQQTAAKQHDDVVVVVAGTGAGAGAGASARPQRKPQPLTAPKLPTSTLLWLRKQTLVLYDPRTGRQLEPLALIPPPLPLPPILNGNKRKPLDQANGNIVQLPQLWNPCSCTEYLCICCLGLRIGDDFINQRICVTLQYTGMLQSTLRLSVSLNERLITNIEVPAQNAAPWCLPVLLPLPVFACLRLYDVRVGSGNAQVCAAFMLNVASQQMLQFPLDCLRFGAAGIALMPPPSTSADTTDTQTNTNTNTHTNGSGDGDGTVGGGGGVSGGVLPFGGEGEPAGEDGDELTLEVRESIQLEENYSGISVEQPQPFVMSKRARG